MGPCHVRSKFFGIDLASLFPTSVGLLRSWVVLIILSSLELCPVFCIPPGGGGAVGEMIWLDTLLVVIVTTIVVCQLTVAELGFAPVFSLHANYNHYCRGGWVSYWHNFSSQDHQLSSYFPLFPPSFLTLLFTFLRGFALSYFEMLLERERMGEELVLAIAYRDTWRGFSVLSVKEKNDILWTVSIVWAACWGRNEC